MFHILRTCLFLSPGRDGRRVPKVALRAALLLLRGQHLLRQPHLLRTTGVVQVAPRVVQRGGGAQGGDAGARAQRAGRVSSVHFRYSLDSGIRLLRNNALIKIRAEHKWAWPDSTCTARRISSTSVCEIVDGLCCSRSFFSPVVMRRSLSARTCFSCSASEGGGPTPDDRFPGTVL